MSSISASFRAPAARYRWLDRLSQESLLVVLVTSFAGFIVVGAPYMLVGDSWLTFLGGREILAHGLPAVDHLTVLGRGRDWVDQQWLAQVVTYELFARFGLRVTLGVFAGLAVAPFALACAIARLRGASVRSVALFALPVMPVAFGAVRAQAFSYVLFVPLVALLVSESRKPTRRVWLALPALVLWANLHGAVLVAAALVSLLGLCELTSRGPRRRGLALLCLPWAAVFATPYALTLVGYYHSTAGNPLFPKYILEWAPPIFPTFVGVPFFLLAAAALALVARRPHDLTRFELGTLGLTLVGALDAERSIIWFSYAALILLPRVLELDWPQAPPGHRLRLLLTACAAAALAVNVVAGFKATAGASAVTRSIYEPQAVAAIRRALAADPGARVIATDWTSDWLLYELPQLRGRIAFDGRWEVLSLGQFQEVRDYLRESGAGWDRLARGYRIVVVDPKRNENLYRTYLARGLRILYCGDRVAVFDADASSRAARRGAPTGSCAA